MLGNMTTRAQSCFVAVALLVGCFYWLRGGAYFWPDGNNLNAYTFTANYYHQPMMDCWRSRVLALKMSSAWTELRDKHQYKTEQDYRDCLADTFASYHVFFLALIFGMLLALKDPLVPLLGTVAGLFYSPAPYFQPYAFPWDFPVMLCFTAAFLAYRARNWWLVIAAVFVGGMIKESVLVAGLFLIGAPWNWYRRFGVVAILGLLVFFLNGLLMPAGAHPSFMMNVVDWKLNLKVLTTDLRLAHPVFACAGGLALLLLFLCKVKDWPLRAVIAAFLAGEFFCGALQEFRIYGEILPLCWIVVSEKQRAKIR